MKAQTMTLPKFHAPAGRLLLPLLAIAAAACDPGHASPAQRDLVTEQRALQTDLTLDVALDAGTNWFTATLPPATVTGTISQEIEGNWDATVHDISQAPIYPQGWTLEYFAGTNMLASPPVTPADWNSVTRVVTTGAAQVEGIDGVRQALVADISAPPATFPASFSGSSSGDGWNAFFDPAHTVVFNEHHHDSPADLMCHILADSGVCPGYPIPLTQTSSRATGFVDAPTNKLWQPTVTSSAMLAWDCVDVTAGTRCAIPTVQSAFAAVDSAYYEHQDPVIIGRKMYAIAAGAGGLGRITCLDMSTATECAGLSLPENYEWESSGIEALGNDLYVLAHGSGFGASPMVRCYDSTTWTPCSGTWPQPTSSTGRMHVVPSPDGTLTNICADWQCWSLDGGATTLPPNYLAYASQHHEGALASNLPAYSNYAHSGSRVAWMSDGTNLQCWDMAIDAKCSSGFPVTVPRPYAATFDPQDNDCVWTNGDDGIIRNYYVPTGALGCAGGPPQITFSAAISIPRLGCDPASRVFEYKSFTLLNPRPSEYTSAALTVKNSLGAPIPGWIGVPMVVDGGSAVVDLTSLTTAIAGVTPEFDVVAAGFTDKTLIPAAEFRVTTGSTPQLCWGLSVPPVTCPSTAGLAGNTQPANISTTVVAKGSYTVGDAGATSLTDQSDNLVVVSDPPNAANCGTQLNVSVQFSGGGPVQGVQVALLNGSGAPVLDASNNPVLGTSDATGNISFVVWPSTYRLQLSDQASSIAVSLQVTAGGSGTTNASGGSVTSSVITTTSTAPASAAAIVTSRPVITAPAAGGLLNTRDVQVTGVCLSGSVVSVFEGSTLLCTSPCSSSAFSCVTSPLSDGSHTVIANETIVNTASVGTTFSIDATPPPAPAITGPVPGAFLATSTPTITGTCESGASVTINESAQALCTATCAAGAFRCTSIALPDGLHTIAATQTDLAGNASQQSAWQSFTIVTVAPASPVVTSPAAGSYVATSSPTLAGTCATGDRVSVSEGTTALCTATCAASTFSCISSALVDGVHTVTALQSDSAGNVSPSSSPVSFTVMTVAPAGPVIQVPAANAFVASATPLISGTCATLDSVSVSEGGTVLCTAACVAGAFSCNSSHLTDGSHSITATQTDQAGNVSPASAAVSFTVITVAPGAPVITSPAAGAYVGATPVISGTCTSGDLVSVSEAGTVLCSSACVAGAFSCASSALVDGVHSVSATQTDPAGNVGPQGWASFIVDTKIPSPPVIASPAAGTFVATATPVIAGKCNTTDMVAVYEGSAVLCSSLCASSTFNCTSSTLADGSHTVTAIQTDVGGNASQASAPSSFTVDTAVPTAPVISVPTANAYVATGTPIISGTCETTDAVVVFEGSNALCSTTCTAGAFSCTSTLLPDGLHTVTAVQTNPAGTGSVASAPVSFNVEAAVTDEPMVTSPANGADVYDVPTVFAGTAPPASTVQLSVDGAPACQGVANAQGAWTCSATVAVGPHIASATATDLAGIVSEPSSSVSFTQRDSIDTPRILSPADGATLYGPTVTIVGSAKAMSNVTVTDGSGATFCQTTAGVDGAFQCVGQASPGPLTMVASSSWRTFQASSAPVSVTVLVDTRISGGGCSAGGTGVNTVLALAVALGLVVSRRRLGARA
jgi:hypothetical protein